MKLKFVKKYLKNNLRKRFIEISHVEFSFSILLIEKFEEELRFYVDYRKLNHLSKKDKYSLFLIDETLIQLKEIKVFLKLNIRQIFHKLKMNMKFENLIIFSCRFEAYIDKILSFELFEESSF